MTEKRFKPVFSGKYNDVFIGVKDNYEDEILMTLDTIDKLNELNDKCANYRQALIDLGINVDILDGVCDD